MASAETRVWTAPVHPDPTNKTASCSPAPVVLRTMSLASCLYNVVCREVTEVVVCVFPYTGKTWDYISCQWEYRFFLVKPLLEWSPRWTLNYGQRQCSHNIEQFSFQRGWKTTISWCFHCGSSVPEKCGVLANHRWVDVFCQCISVSFRLQSNSLDIILFALRWQFIEFPVARTPSSAFHLASEVEIASQVFFSNNFSGTFFQLVSYWIHYSHSHLILPRNDHIWIVYWISEICMKHSEWWLSSAGPSRPVGTMFLIEKKAVLY